MSSPCSFPDGGYFFRVIYFLLIVGCVFLDQSTVFLVSLEYLYLVFLFIIAHSILSFAILCTYSWNWVLVLYFFRSSLSCPCSTKICSFLFFVYNSHFLNSFRTLYLTLVHCIILLCILKLHRML